MKSYKHNFPIFENNPELVYLDSSSTSQTPEAVLSVMDEYYRSYRANSRRGQYSISARAESEYEDARKEVAKFIGANVREVIFTGGATASANLIVFALEHSDIFSQGDEIVTTIMEHHSLFIPLQKLAKRKKLTLRIIPVDGNLELDYGAAEKLMNEKTKLVAFVGVSNVTGTINDMARLCALARKFGAYSLVDATQGVGHVPVDVKQIDCDFLFFAGHKMCGPIGTGVLYGREGILEKLEPGFYGGGTVEEVTQDDVRFSPIPHKFEAGTPNIGGAIGLGAACKYLSAIGLEKIQAHSEDLAAYAFSKLGAVSGVKLYSVQDPKKNAGVVSFTVEGIHPHDVGEILSRNNIATRGGHHCAQPLLKALGVTALNRASFYFYTAKEDIDALVLGLVDVRKVLDR
ncbi:MAG: cysteine desulfurase [Parcubacteria group bacterium]|nr:cysteine desulfurase [Parcubacteria group bacterium]